MTAGSSSGGAVSAVDPRQWSGREWAVLLVVGLALAGGVAYLAADLTDGEAPQTEQTTVSLDQPPSDVMTANDELLLRVDHRRLTNVSRVVDGEREHLYTFEDVYDHSDRQYVANYDGSGGNVAYTHNNPFTLQTLAHDSALVYAHDGWLNMARGFSHSAIGDYEVNATGHRVSDAIVDVRYRYPDGDPAGNGLLREATHHDRIVYRTPFVNASVPWEQTDETDDTVTYSITNASTYATVRPMYMAHAVHDGSRLSVTLSRETGRIQSMTEHRIVTTRNEAETFEDSRQRVHFVIETQFSDYENVDITRPSWVVPRETVTD